MKKTIAAIVASLALILALSACTTTEYEERKQKQNQTTLTSSLGIENQKERLQREEDPNAIRYVYLLAKLDGSVLGYYTIQGKVSAAGTQLAPEQEIILPCSGCDRQVVDSAKDDGTYGDSDSGSFSFTTEGVLIETTLDYIQSDAPVAFYGDVPKLNE